MTDDKDNWVAALMDGAFDDPSGRILSMSCDELEVDGLRVGRVQLTFTVEDLRGKTYEAKGRLLLPDSLRDAPGERMPVMINCGYESPESHGAAQVALGRVSATTVQLPLDDVYPNAWSLIRGPKMEVVLSHLVRSLSFVDVAQVVYTGGSAGGYSSLMAASDAFPAAAVVAGVPPTNLAYMGSLWATNYQRLQRTRAPSLGWFEGLRPAVEGWRDAFGEDPDAPGWLGHSPVAHVDRVTSPVMTFFSASDPLVPIDQVDHDLAAPFIAARPGDVDIAAESVSDSAAVKVRLLDALGDRADVHVVPVPDGLTPMTEADLTMLAEAPPFPVPEVEPVANRWQVVVADEGEPVWVVSHFKHHYEPDFAPFTDRALAGGIGVDQLTEAKLDQLLDRYSGTEWLAPGFHSLDRPEAEKADVERGLRTYCAASPEHAARFRDLYGAVPGDRRVLPDPLVAALERDASEKS